MQTEVVVWVEQSGVLGSPVTEKRSLIVVARRQHMMRAQGGFHEALSRKFHVKPVYIEDGWPEKASDIADYNDYDAWVWWVPFRRLRQRNGFDWVNYQGLRVMFDLDAHANSHRMVGASELGMWPRVFHSHDFHILVCTGRRTRDELLADGVPAHWLPKAYDPGKFRDLGLPRHGYCQYGRPYYARRLVMDFVKRQGIEISRIECAYDELNDRLNRYSACLVCNMAASLKPGIWRLVRRFSPIRATRLELGAEPMLKNFECAGAGCAPVVDWIDELSELGFEDGESIVSYRSMTELVDKLHYYGRYPEVLNRIGKRAASLVASRHTWDHRAHELDKLIADNS